MNELRGSKFSKAEQRRAFNVLVEAARVKVRCPTNDYFSHGAVAALAHAGWIRIYVYARNWRVVEIITGPHAGARTAPPPRAYACYRVLDAVGKRRPTAEDLAA